MSGTRKALIAFGVILLVLVLTLAGIALAVRHSINSQIQHLPSALPSAAEQSGDSQSAESGSESTPINFLVMGSDSRELGGDPSDWQSNLERSDVLMLVQITGDREGMNVMSIPRDSWVSIPEHGEAKINAALAYGGTSLAVTTVQNLTGVHIDHVALVDFETFKEMTDELGGVTISTEEGDQTMDGSEALTFVRERYSLPRGDFDRVRRQQAWIKAIMTKVFDKDVLTSPSEISSLTSVFFANSYVDDSLDADTMMSLALSMRNLRSSGVEFLTAPNNGTGTSDDGQSTVVLNDELLGELSRAWQNDTVSDFLSNHPEIQTLSSEPVA